MSAADTSTEQHRLDCEVRYVLAKPLEARRAYLAAVERHRGAAGAAYLKDAIAAEWGKRKEAA